jgi:hypothetical protein
VGGQHKVPLPIQNECKEMKDISEKIGAKTRTKK